MNWRFGWFFAALLLLPTMATLAPAASSDPLVDIIMQSPVLERFGFTAAPPQDGPPSLAGLVLLGIQNNRGLRAAAAQVLTARERVPQVTALPEPRLALQQYIEPVETRVGPQRQAVSLTQSFPWFGTLGLKGDIEKEKALLAEARLDGQILDLITNIKRNVFELAYLDTALAVTRDHLHLLTQWEQTAQSRYAAGHDRFANLIKTQVELGKLTNHLAELEDRRDPLVAAINSDLDRDPNAPLPVTDLPSSPAEVPPTATLQQRMVGQNPQLDALAHQEAAAGLLGRLAAKEGRPSFDIGLNLIRTGPARMSNVPDSGRDALTATVGIKLPLWRSKYGAAVQEAASGMAAADNAGRQKANALTAALSRQLFGFRDARRQEDLYGTTLLPNARQSLEAAQAAFAAGNGSFLEVIDAERLLLEFQLAASRARTDLLIQQAMIEGLLAGPLPIQP